MLMACLSLPHNLLGDVHVHGYVKKDGTYVKPYHRSNPNNSKYDNYSTKGNYNPYTGKKGTKSPNCNYSYYGTSC